MFTVCPRDGERGGDKECPMQQWGNEDSHRIGCHWALASGGPWLAQISPLSPGFLVADWAASSRPEFPVFVPILPDVISPEALSKNSLKFREKRISKTVTKIQWILNLTYVAKGCSFLTSVTVPGNNLQCFFLCADILFTLLKLLFTQFTLLCVFPFLLSSQGYYRKNENHN